MKDGQSFTLNQSSETVMTDIKITFYQSRCLADARILVSKISIDLSGMLGAHLIDTVRLNLRWRLISISRHKSRGYLPQWFPWYERYIQVSEFHAERLPFHDVLGFAAFHGCGKYVLRHTTSHGCTREELDYLLACTAMRTDPYPGVMDSFTFIGELLGQGADPNLSIDFLSHRLSIHSYHISS